MPTSRSALRPVLYLLLPIALVACDPRDRAETVRGTLAGVDTPPAVTTEGEHAVTIESETATETTNLPLLPAPPGAPSCPVGNNRGRSERIGEAGGTVRIGPPETRRPAILQVPAWPGADEQTFALAETAVDYPEVEATGPPGRNTRITLFANGCRYSGRLVVHRWNGTRWEPLPSIQPVVEDSSVTAEPDAFSRFALGTD